MTVIGDSTSFYDENRQLPQHQAVLTLIRLSLDDPAVTAYRWLDLGCGQGQIVAQTADNLSAAARAKIEYIGIDGNEEYARFCSGKAMALGIGSATCVCGLLDDLSLLLAPDCRFDMVTFINTAHELAPFRLPELIFDAMARLTASGILYAYDMQALEPNELGAVTWSDTEMFELLEVLLAHVTDSKYCPKVAHWRHSKASGWSFELQGRVLCVTPAELAAKRAEALAAAETKMAELIERKHRVCRALLDSFVEQKRDSAADIETKQRALYNFYALTRAGERR